MGRFLSMPRFLNYHIFLGFNRMTDEVLGFSHELQISNKFQAKSIRSCDFCICRLGIREHRVSTVWHLIQVFQSFYFSFVFWPTGRDIWTNTTCPRPDPGQQYPQRNPQYVKPSHQ
jgi:hypothetical protein